MYHDYLKHKGDLVLAVAVVVNIKDNILECEFLYVHDSAPDHCVLQAPTGEEYKVNLDDFKKICPTTYTGDDLRLCLISR